LKILHYQGHCHRVVCGGHVQPTFTTGCSWDCCKFSEYLCRKASRVGHVWSL